MRYAHVGRCYARGCRWKTWRCQAMLWCLAAGQKWIDKAGKPTKLVVFYLKEETWLNIVVSPSNNGSLTIQK